MDKARTDALIKHDLETLARILKKKIKEKDRQKLNTFAANVEDKVHLHDHGWKVRYCLLQYVDTCFKRKLCQC